MDRVLDQFGAASVRVRLEAAGVLATLEQRGFRHLDVVVDAAGWVLPHILLFGEKDGRRFLLLDACIGAAAVPADFFQRRGYPMDGSVELAVVHWVREEDPTARFAVERPALPLQRHPGLGTLRRAFRVAICLAREAGKDGIVSVPKFFHDAVLFFRSRLFLFLDGDEQGRFEALIRDLQPLALGDASLVIASGGVRDATGTAIRWSPGYQVFPISERLTGYLHSPLYAEQVARGRNAAGFSVDADAVARARERFGDVLAGLQLDTTPSAHPRQR